MSPDPKPDLTARQIEVLRAVAAGDTDLEISNRMFLSTRAVKKDLENARAELGTRNRTHSVARAYELGVLP